MINDKSSSDFFVIIAERRSGSTFLTKALSMQKDILFYSLVGLGVEYSSFGKDHKKNREKRRNFHSGPNGTILVQSAHSILLKNKKNKKFFGFKGHPERLLDVPNFFQYLYEKNAKVIFLTRNNLLLRFVSARTAASIGSNSCSSRNKKIFKLNPIKIGYKSFVKNKNKVKEIEKKVLLNINKYNIPYMHITYEEISENFNEYLKKIFNFLEINPDTMIDVTNENGEIASLKKINVYKLKDKILNYEKFKKKAEKNNDIETLNFLIE
jgi:hypothetical protein